MVIVSESQSRNKPAVQVFPMQLWENGCRVIAKHQTQRCFPGLYLHYLTKAAIWNGSGASSKQHSDPPGD